MAMDAYDYVNNFNTEALSNNKSKTADTKTEAVTEAETEAETEETLEDSITKNKIAPRVENNSVSLENKNTQQNTHNNGRREKRGTDSAREVGEGRREEVQRGNAPRESGRPDVHLQPDGERSHRVHGVQVNETVSVPLRNANNHTIAPGARLAPRGETAKINANIAAIRLLKELQEQKKTATPTQKSVLQQYTGWGGLSSIFKTSHPRYNELKEILSQQEYGMPIKTKSSIGLLNSGLIPLTWQFQLRILFVRQKYYKILRIPN